MVIDNDDAVWDLFKIVPSNGGPSTPDLTTCQFCKATDSVILDDGNYVCVRCNSIADRFIDDHAEWRCYSNDDSKFGQSNDPSRCGPPINELMPSLGSVVSTTLKAGQASAPSSDGVNMLRSVQRYHMWNSSTYKERNLFKVFDFMNHVASSNGIAPCILDRAKVMYKSVSEMKISRGANRLGLIACSIYMACKLNQVPRSIREVAAMFDIKVPVVTKSCKVFQELMHLNVMSSTPIDFVSRFCAKLGLPEDITQACQLIVTKIQDEELMTDNTPPTIVAGVIMFVSAMAGIEVDKERLANTCFISSVTVVKCHKKIHALAAKTDGFGIVDMTPTPK